MATETPVASSQSEVQNPSSRPMGSIDIGLIVGAVALFLIVITSIFVARGLDGRRRARGMLHRAEGGNAANQDEHHAARETSITGVPQPEPAHLRHKSF
ncbi:hypothetical protein FLAG1_08358 [Fusarium langsethiae]|uniref:Uncharacterized protein n=1 Tax=Fusarium langsethiae TaxID=179993 RepID=A0A0N0DCW9_FUSLA|nr:hypothetical protein FLAG1_08358 [Fusarium langsethiae]GKU05457.1 unnamed protein product [Fusarium langsethiae]GKU20938.1 unnamed protein product [Fusarium langsethiae]